MPDRDELCECGCGQPTSIASRTDRSRGWIKGQPVRFIPGHNAGTRPPSPQLTDGRCACGCGQLAPLARSSNAKRGRIKGQPLRYVAGHSRHGTLRHRLFSKLIIDPNGCLLWTGTTTGDDGYGRIMVDGQMVPVHRVMYEMFVGPIPEGLELDHVKALGCRHKNCASPVHLEPVTGRENKMRSDSVCAINNRKTRCKYGHKFTPENTYISPKGYRYCRTCVRSRAKKRRGLARKKAA